MSGLAIDASVELDATNPMLAGADLAGKFVMPLAYQVAEQFPEEARAEFLVGLFSSVSGHVSASIGPEKAVELLTMMAGDMRKISAGAAAAAKGMH